MKVFTLKIYNLRGSDGNVAACKFTMLWELYVQILSIARNFQIGKCNLDVVGCGTCDLGYFNIGC